MMDDPVVVEIKSNNGRKCTINLTPNNDGTMDINFDFEPKMRSNDQSLFGGIIATIGEALTNL